MHRILAQFRSPVISHFGVRRLAAAFAVVVGVTPRCLRVRRDALLPRRGSPGALRLFSFHFRTFVVRSEGDAHHASTAP
jgi:hypothetical protein